MNTNMRESAVRRFPLRPPGRRRIERGRNAASCSSGWTASRAAGGGAPWRSSKRNVGSRPWSRLPTCCRQSRLPTCCQQHAGCRPASPAALALAGPDGDAAGHGGQFRWRPCGSVPGHNRPGSDRRSVPAGLTGTTEVARAGRPPRGRARVAARQPGLRVPWRLVTVSAPGTARSRGGPSACRPSSATASTTSGCGTSRRPSRTRFCRRWPAPDTRFNSGGNWFPCRCRTDGDWWSRSIKSKCITLEIRRTNWHL